MRAQPLDPPINFILIAAKKFPEQGFLRAALESTKQLELGKTQRAARRALRPTAQLWWKR
eukprot:6314828-Pyramimonas_sp.AAC.1